jgi:hypothetical protein
VAVLTYGVIDASTINPDTMVFAGAEPVRWTLEDVNLDGYLDLLLHFKTQELNLTQTGWATVTGNTYDGQSVEGRDWVRIVHKPK